MARATSLTSESSTRRSASSRYVAGRPLGCRKLHARGEMEIGLSSPKKNHVAIIPQHPFSVQTGILRQEYHSYELGSDQSQPGHAGKLADSTYRSESHRTYCFETHASPTCRSSSSLPHPDEYLSQLPQSYRPSSSTIQDDLRYSSEHGDWCDYRYGRLQQPSRTRTSRTRSQCNGTSGSYQLQPCRRSPSSSKRSVCSQQTIPCRTSSLPSYTYSHAVGDSQLPSTTVYASCSSPCRSSFTGILGEQLYSCIKVGLLPCF